MLVPSLSLSLSGEIRKIYEVGIHISRLRFIISDGRRGEAVS